MERRKTRVGQERPQDLRMNRRKLGLDDNLDQRSPSLRDWKSRELLSLHRHFQVDHQRNCARQWHIGQVHYDESGAWTPHHVGGYPLSDREIGDSRHHPSEIKGEKNSSICSTGSIRLSSPTTHSRGIDRDMSRDRNRHAHSSQIPSRERSDYGVMMRSVTWKGDNPPNWEAIAAPIRYPAEAGFISVRPPSARPQPLQQLLRKTP